MTTTGPGILENQNQMLGTKSRLVWETDWCKSASATMQRPSEAQRFAAIDLSLMTTLNGGPPTPTRTRTPSSGPPLPAGLILDPCGRSELLLCSSAGCLWGDFSMKPTFLSGNAATGPRFGAYEDERCAASHYRPSAPGERGRGPRWLRL